MTNLKRTQCTFFDYVKDYTTKNKICQVVFKKNIKKEYRYQKTDFSIPKKYKKRGCPKAPSKFIIKFLIIT